MKLLSKISIFLITLICCSFSFAGEKEDTRRQMPAVFDHSWIGLTGGMTNTNYNNSDFKSGFQFKNIHDDIAAVRLSIGHYFNPYIGLAASLMRGIHSNKFSGPTRNGRVWPEDTYSVSNSLFGVTALPTLPLGHGFSLYGEGGVGMVSRHGFAIQNLPAVDDTNILTAIVGGGVTYDLPYHLALNLNTIYTPAVKHKQQPSIFYIGLGLNYTLIDHKTPHPNAGTYWFPLNFLQVDYTNDNWFYFDVAKYVTTPKSIPIFFDGHIKIGQGLEFIYERNFFHTDKNFSLEWGVSSAYWRTRYSPQSFYTLSIFPEMKVWMVRCPSFDFYFTYSLAGPSYISRRYFAGLDSGSHFTFQDFLGLGAFVGKSKRVNINVKIVHYSNGNSLPSNPGVDVPVMLGIGVSF